MYLCFDMGGTQVKAGIIDSTGNIIVKVSEPTKKREGMGGVVRQFYEMRHALLEKAGVSKGSIKGVGVGIPGLVDMDKGVVVKAVNLGWENAPIRGKLEEYMECPTLIINDANAAALGEMWKGAGSSCKDIICITLGTGIGAGIIIGGKIYNGVLGMAGEIGHMKVRTEGGRRCNCGKSGCLETESSGRAIAYNGEKAAREGEAAVLAEILKNQGWLTSKDISDAASRGDICAINIFGRAAYYLGLALANIYVVLAPQRIIIGGGVAAAGDVLFKPLIKWFNCFTFGNIGGEKIIYRAELGNDAGIIGLAKLLETRFKE